MEEHAHLILHSHRLLHAAGLVPEPSFPLYSASCRSSEVKTDEQETGVPYSNSMENLQWQSVYPLVESLQSSVSNIGSTSDVSIPWLKVSNCLSPTSGSNGDVPIPLLKANNSLSPTSGPPTAMRLSPGRKSPTTICLYPG